MCDEPRIINDGRNSSPTVVSLLPTSPRLALWARFLSRVCCRPPPPYIFVAFPSITVFHLVPSCDMSYIKL